jgi:hypothetical protein
MARAWLPQYTLGLPRGAAPQQKGLAWAAEPAPGLGLEVGFVVSLVS